MTAHMSLPLNASNGARLVSADGRTLPLKAVSLTAEARGGLARVTLQQHFANPFAEALKVTYTLPLPADGAVSGFAFTLGTERIVGQVDTKKQARERFEEAILEGRTAAILDQERSSLFTQEVGNVPPHSEVTCEITVDQKLAWLPDGGWEWRFPTVVAPRYLGGQGVENPERVTVDIADGPLPIRASLSLTIREAISSGRAASPSHSLHTSVGTGGTVVEFSAGDGSALDRDVVVRWNVAQPSVGVSVDVGAAGTGEAAGVAYGLLTLVPPEAQARMTPVARDLIVLLDTSGSMSGEPLAQAKRIVSALIDSLQDADQLELIEFSYAPRKWKNGPVSATAANRKAAQAWLSALEANSSTEMHTAMMAALAPLRAEAQRQVVLITDGLIGNENAILGEIVNRLPGNCRVHTVGIGSGVNRSLTSPAARAGRGTEINIATGEDAEVAARRILLRTASPLVTELVVGGSAVEGVAPARLPDLYAGSPSLVSLKLKSIGGTLRVTGKTADGTFTREIAVGGTESHSGPRSLATLYAREMVEDLELRRAAGEGSPVLDRQVEKLGLTFQISTRLTSWIAVSSKQTVDPTGPRRSETVPHVLAHGLSAEGVGLRQATGALAPAKKLRVGAPMPVMAARRAAPPPPAAAPAPEPMMRFEEAAEKAADHADEPAPIVAEEDGLYGSLADSKEVTGAFEAAAPAKAKAAAPAAPAARSGGPIERLKKAFGIGAGGGSGAGKSEAAAPKGQASAPRVLKGRLVLSREGKLFVEITVDGAGLDWAPAGDVKVDLASGERVTAQIVTEGTTRAGQLGAGLLITLALKVSGTLEGVTRVTVVSGGQVLQVELS